MKKNRSFRYVYNFSVDCNVISVNDILNFHNYLEKIMV